MNDIEHLDLEDDYPEYVDETWGYAWDVWDTTHARNISRHRKILAEGSDDDPAGLSNFDRWALVRHQQESGEPFLDSLRLMLTSPQDHGGLNLPEIFEFAIRALAHHGLFDEAEHAEQKLEELWPEYPGLSLASMTRKALEGRDREELAHEAIESWSEDVDQLIDFAKEWRYLGESEMARKTLSAARSIAQTNDDRPSLLDIELMLSELE